MKCNSCGKEITYGYFWEGSEVKYICTDCLLSYRKKKLKIYDRKQIMEMHAKGYALRTIATVMGTNTLTIGCIKAYAQEEPYDMYAVGVLSWLIAWWRELRKREER